MRKSAFRKKGSRSGTFQGCIGLILTVILGTLLYVEPGSAQTATDLPSETPAMLTPV